MSSSHFEPTPGDNAREVPTRLLLVQEEARPAVDIHEEKMVMTFPHLVVLELLVLVAGSLALVLLALFFNAPLEELANPLKTPNPAKAPWYFLGLQELLHYYPPVISGVVLPGAVMVALAVVPYFEVNLHREPFWEHGRKRKMTGVLAAIAALTATFYFTGAHPVWPIIGPTWFVGFFMLWPAFFGTGSRWGHWLGTRSLPFWIFLWFLIDAVVLTLIGIFFRGPGWSFTLPWVDGIF